jgi:hypothetical protein
MHKVLRRNILAITASAAVVSIAVLAHPNGHVPSPTSHSVAGVVTPSPIESPTATPTPAPTPTAAPTPMPTPAAAPVTVAVAAVPAPQVHVTTKAPEAAVVPVASAPRAASAPRVDAQPWFVTFRTYYTDAHMSYRAGERVAVLEPSPIIVNAGTASAMSGWTTISDSFPATVASRS